MENERTIIVTTKTKSVVWTTIVVVFTIAVIIPIILMGSCATCATVGVVSAIGGGDGKLSSYEQNEQNIKDEITESQRRFYAEQQEASNADQKDTQDLTTRQSEILSKLKEAQKELDKEQKLALSNLQKTVLYRAAQQGLELANKHLKSDPGNKSVTALIQKRQHFQSQIDEMESDIKKLPQVATAQQDVDKLTSEIRNIKNKIAKTEARRVRGK